MVKSFKSFLNERVLSIGLNPEHEQHREKHRQEIHDLIHKSYKGVSKDDPDEGYGGHKSGSKEESDAIHHDITHSKIKAIKRDGKISAVNLYKTQHGRKSIASATNGTEQGKKDWKQIKHEDNKEKRAWGEVSGAAKAVQKKMGVPVVDTKHAERLIGKKVNIKDKESYTRKIGGKEHEKSIMGHPKED